MSKILICGASSFVGRGFAELAEDQGYEVDLFSRGGHDERSANCIRGSYLEIDRNKYLSDSYDYVINFAVLKDSSVEDNVNYIKALVEMCKCKHVKKLIHFSSIMVYARTHNVIDETTTIEDLSKTIKNGYGLLKIATDQILKSLRDSIPFELVLIRPGYVLAPGVRCPFVKHIIGNVHLILGNRTSSMPIVRREDIHKALLRIMIMQKNLPVYHFFPDSGITKLQYAKENVEGLFVCLPKCLFKGVPYALAMAHIIPWSLYSRFEGMFTMTKYISTDTEKALGISFK